MCLSFESFMPLANLGNSSCLSILMFFKVSHSIYDCINLNPSILLLLLSDKPWVSSIHMLIFLYFLI